MHFRISDTFTGCLAKLTGDKQKAAKTSALLERTGNCIKN